MRLGAILCGFGLLLGCGASVPGAEELRATAGGAGDAGELSMPTAGASSLGGTGGGAGSESGTGGVPSSGSGGSVAGGGGGSAGAVSVAGAGTGGSSAGESSAGTGGTESAGESGAAGAAGSPEPEQRCAEHGGNYCEVTQPSGTRRCYDLAVRDAYWVAADVVGVEFGEATEPVELTPDTPFVLSDVTIRLWKSIPDECYASDEFRWTISSGSADLSATGALLSQRLPAPVEGQTHVVTISQSFALDPETDCNEVPCEIDDALRDGVVIEAGALPQSSCALQLSDGDDFSFAILGGGHQNFAVYVRGALVWGCEPPGYVEQLSD